MWKPARTLGWGHAALADDLVEHYRLPGFHLYREVGLGSWSSEGLADVLGVFTSWTRPLPTIYEVKVTRSDLMRDLRDEKWRKYLPWCERLYFAVPSGLITSVKLPREVGIIERMPEGQWILSRRTQIRPMSRLKMGEVFFRCWLREQRVAL